MHPGITALQIWAKTNTRKAETCPDTVKKNIYIFTSWFKQEDSSMIFHQKAKYLTTIVFTSTKTSDFSHQNSTQNLSGSTH